MLIHCRSDAALILIPLQNGSGSWVFPSDSGPFIGIHTSIESQLPIVPQILETIHIRLGIDPLKAGYKVCEEFEETVVSDNGQTMTLFVMQCERDLTSISAINAAAEPALRFASMPEWLSRLPATRSRLAWIKAWQVYQGVLSETIKAVDTNDLKSP